MYDPTVHVELLLPVMHHILKNENWSITARYKLLIHVQKVLTNPDSVMIVFGKWHIYLYCYNYIFTYI